jgi:hypothetical protein
MPSQPDPPGDIKHMETRSVVNAVILAVMHVLCRLSGLDTTTSYR